MQRQAHFLNVNPSENVCDEFEKQRFTLSLPTTLMDLGEIMMKRRPELHLDSLLKLEKVISMRVKAALRENNDMMRHSVS